MLAKNESGSFEALSSPIRLEILRVLARKQMTVSDLASHLGIHGATVRYHLSALVAQGLLRTVPGRVRGRRGRPPVTYKLDTRATIPGFPKRQYAMLAEIVLRTIKSNLEERTTSRMLKEAGMTAGRAFGGALLAANSGLSGRVGMYVHAIAESLRNEYGIDAEADGEGEDEATLTEYSCPFEELAMKYPDLICDNLDMGFQQGIASALGEGTTAEKLKCKGHGDDVCQFRLAKTRV